MPSQRPSRKYYLFTLVCFAAAVTIGYFLAAINRNAAKDFIQSSLSPFKFIADLPPFQAFIFIFLNNAIKSFFVIILGTVFGLLSLYFILANGLLIGLVFAVYQARFGIAVPVIGLLPHGLLELFALWITATWDVWLGVRFFRYLVFAEKFGQSFRHALTIYIIWIVPLLLMAAFIETYLTSFLLRMVQ